MSTKASSEKVYSLGK